MCLVSMVHLLAHIVASQEIAHGMVAYSLSGKPTIEAIITRLLELRYLVSLSPHLTVKANIPNAFENRFAVLANPRAQR